MPEDARHKAPLSRRAVLGVAVVGVGTSVLAACSVLEPPPRPRSHGIIGDGTSNDAPALQSALDRAARAGAPLKLPPRLALRLETGIHVPSGTRLDGNGSTLLNAAPGDATCALSIVRAHDVTLENVVIDGMRTSHAQRTEQRHNIRISGSENVVLSNIESRDAKGDGLYVGDHVNGPSRQVRVVDSIFSHNLRQGMSVTCASGLAVTRCTFSDTGGTAPGAGVDIEPNTADSVIEDLTFASCDFVRNLGGGLLIVLSESPVVPQSGGQYDGCNFSDNQQADGVFLVRSGRTIFAGGRATGNGRNGIRIAAPNHISARVSNTIMSDCAVTGNRQSGVLITSPYDRLEFDRCQFRSNGRAVGAGGFFGIDSSPRRGDGQGLVVRQSLFDDMLCGIRLNSATLAPVLSGNTFTSVMEDVHLVL